MHLTPKDEDRLLLFLAAELARKRRARGLRMTYAEARALIADEIVEAARDGVSVTEAAQRGRSLLTEDDVLPEVPTLIGTVQVEGFFEDGQKLVTVHDPIAPGQADNPAPRRIPGEVIVENGELEINAGRRAATVRVVNAGDRPIQVGSHFHFFEVNRALAFDRSVAYGRRLDIPSGTAVRFEAGEERDVVLVDLGGSREVHGLNGVVDGPLAEHASREDLDRLDAMGFAHVPVKETT